MATNQDLGQQVVASIGKYETLLRALPQHGTRWPQPLVLAAHRLLGEDMNYRTAIGCSKDVNALPRYISEVATSFPEGDIENPLTKLLQARLYLATRLLEQRLYEEQDLRANPILPSPNDGEPVIQFEEGVQGSYHPIEK